MCAASQAMASNDNGAYEAVDREKKELEDMMKRLGLSETDFDDVVFEKEDQPPPEAT